MTEAITVPEIGENVESGVVVAVHIKVGDTIAVDDTVIELETDKALVEIPSPFSGRVTAVLAEAGAQMRVGDVIARIETDAAATTEKGGGEPEKPAEKDEHPPVDKKTAAAPADAAPDSPAGGESKPDAPTAADTTADDDGDRPPAAAAPSIRRLARELGVDIHDVNGSGPDGRIREADVKAYVRQRPAVATGGGEMKMPDFSRWGSITTEPLETVRRLTARSTANAWAVIPHVTQHDEADITDVAAFIAAQARRADKAGVKLTLTAVLTRICAEALKRFPRFNASIDVAGGRLILKKYIHIGIAADTPRGLLVPVVRDADRKGILELAGAIQDLAERARSKKIKPDEMEGATFTISNQGGIGGVAFTPIVMWPQAAILGVSRSAVKPVYNGETFEPRTLLPLSLSYDHRIIDGADAARFLRWICEGLAQPLTLFLD